MANLNKVMLIGRLTHDPEVRSFANGGKVDCVWVHGKKQVSGGRHAKREAVAKRFREVMTALSQG